jgi:hypothetical protein
VLFKPERSAFVPPGSYSFVVRRTQNAEKVGFRLLDYAMGAVGLVFAAVFAQAWLVGRAGFGDLAAISGLPALLLELVCWFWLSVLVAGSVARLVRKRWGEWAQVAAIVVLMTSFLPGGFKESRGDMFLGFFIATHCCALFFLGTAWFSRSSPRE